MLRSPTSIPESDRAAGEPGGDISMGGLAAGGGDSGSTLPSRGLTGDETLEAELPNPPKADFGVVALVPPPNAEEPKPERGLSVLGVVVSETEPNMLVVGAEEPKVTGFAPNPAKPPPDGAPAGVVEVNFPKPPTLLAPKLEDTNVDVVPNAEGFPNAVAEVCPNAGVAAGVVEGCPNAGVVDD
ncbi:hypothetical protein OPQ81_001760 [Rhizoctonia solani]|nr:hypothetical protein OPQ81_001760 [Rhizoctonia solani]